MDNMIVVAIMVLGCILINPFVKASDKAGPETEQADEEEKKEADSEEKESK
jgi:cellobiose-specific phosphotransferase system component IIC